MINLQLFVVTSILMLFGSRVSGMLSTKGPCLSNLTAVGDLNMERYLGKWYTQLMYPYSNLKRLGKCKSVEFIENPSGKFYLLKREISTKTETYVERKESISSVDSKSGTFVLASKNKMVERGLEVFVLDTDYDQFTIHYVCIDSDAYLNFQWLSILTRKRLPKPSVLKTALNLAQSLGANTEKLQKIEQQACPKN